MDCSPPGSVHGILQARILEWVAISFSRGSSQLRVQTQVSCIASRRFNWNSEPPGKPIFMSRFCQNINKMVRLESEKDWVGVRFLNAVSNLWLNSIWFSAPGCLLRSSPSPRACLICTTRGPSVALDPFPGRKLEQLSRVRKTVCHEAAGCLRVGFSSWTVLHLIIKVIVL